MSRIITSIGIKGYKVLNQTTKGDSLEIDLQARSKRPKAETETLRERILSGLDEAKKKGVKLGRPEGSAMSTDEFLKKHKDVARLVREKHSIRNTAKISGKGISTVQKVKACLKDSES